MQTDGKIQALNNAIREAIPHMQTAAEENPNFCAGAAGRAISHDISQAYGQPCACRSGQAYAQALQ
jgi:hypothetical protein